MFAKGSEGGIELAEKVVAACDKKSEFKLLYPDEISICDKISTIAKNIYGADGVVFEPAAKKAIAEIEKLAVRAVDKVLVFGYAWQKLSIHSPTTRQNSDVRPDLRLQFAT